MWIFIVVVAREFRYSRMQVRHRPRGIQVDVLLLDCARKTLYPNIILVSLTTIHTDLSSMLLQETTPPMTRIQYSLV